jgi:hypothetical protein
MSFLFFLNLPFFTQDCKAPEVAELASKLQYLRQRHSQHIQSKSPAYGLPKPHLQPSLAIPGSFSPSPRIIIVKLSA